ncbi:hypothetical protein VPNG_06852 [Cytospora leucostoma]|uniref:DUF6536 domain-containing protein n=1 Tax=Cytospora leucostoma TaxID=1230097 RepID=A0A423WVX7_9PEZI|nr:hypothetical protein VPNG_06852 [Cytospora leucostoma]
MSIFTSHTPELFRRTTVQVQNRGAENDSGAGTRDSTLIPDYVVNFIRGETPETVARRKQNGGNQGMRAVDITHQHRHQRSHMALLENANENENDARRAYDAQSNFTWSSTMTQLQQMLPWSNEKPGTRRRLMTGWRFGVLVNILLIIVVFITGFICAVYAGSKVPITTGEMDLFTGSCQGATSIDWGLHALINVFVMILIVGASYIFQVLSSPTRSEVSRAHDGKQWLEIGVPSVRNFGHIAKLRAVLAIALLTMAVATQIMYNSIIFTSQPEVSYNLIVVSESFLSGWTFSNTSSNNEGGLTRNEILQLRNLASHNELANLTTSECIGIFKGAFNTDFRNVLLVLDTLGSEDSLVATAQAGIDGNKLQAANDMSISINNDQLFFDGTPVGFCLAQHSETSEELCTVQLSIFVFVAVLALNLITLLIAATTLVLKRFEPLVTLGDAITSFLRDPDPTTRTNCLLTKQNLRTGMGGWGFSEGKYWTPKRDHMWFRSPSLANWTVAGSWWLTSTGLVLAALAITVGSQPSSQPLSPFGVASPHTTYLLPLSASASIPAGALAIATAIPQLLLAGLYFSTNALLTSYFLSRESSLYAILDDGAGRPLRVSADPEGRQTTSLYLTLPRPVSWALAVLFASMGFVLSQAFFVVSLSPTDITPPQQQQQQHVLGVGLSGVALVVLLAMLVILLLVILGMGFLKAPSAAMCDGRAVGNPLVFEGGSCSAVISARCHRVPWEADVWKQRVGWGAVPEMPGAVISHATYSARSVAELDGTRRYA